MEGIKDHVILLRFHLVLSILLKLSFKGTLISKCDLDVWSCGNKADTTSSFYEGHQTGMTIIRYQLAETKVESSAFLPVC